MKKFLSILLALAVAFTFTFGSTMSAFAEQTVAEKIDAAAVANQTEVDKAVKAELDSIVYDQAGYVFYVGVSAATDDQKLLNAAALAKGADAAKAAAYEAIANEVRAQKLADSFDSSKFNIAPGTAFNKTAYVEMFAVEKANKLAEIAKVDASAYLSYDYTPNDGVANSDMDKVVGLVNTATTAVNEIALADTDDQAQVISKIKAVKAVAIGDLPAKTAAQYEKDLTEAKAAAKTTIEATATNLKDTLKSAYTKAVNGASTPTEKAEAQAKLNAVDTNVNTIVNKYLAKINAVAITKDVKPSDAMSAIEATMEDADKALSTQSGYETEISVMANIDSLVAYAKTIADAKKVELEVDGTIKYVSASVDKVYEDTVAKIKDGKITTIAGVTNAFADPAITTVAGAARALKAAKEAAESTITGKYTSGYAEAEAAKIAELKVDAKAAVAAATSEEEVTKALADFDAAVAKLPTSEQIGKLETAANNAITTLKYDTALGRLYDATVLAAPVDTYNTAAKDNVLNAAKKVMVDAVLANIDATKAYSTTDVENVVKANYDSAKAVITGMATNAALEAQVAAVIAKIDAIPSTITLADMATVEAADEAYKALVAVPTYTTLDPLKKVPTAKESNLNVAKATIKKLEGKAVQDAVKALYDKVATLTAADEAAYTAAKEASDAYDKKYANGNDELLVATKLADIKAAIDTAKFNDAANAINAIPENLTKEDKALVEAARKAFDALTKTQQDNLAQSLKDKLFAAEAEIAELTKYTDVNAKADLLDMSRKLTIWRTSKTSIRVTAVGSVKNIKDNGYTVEYKFYKKAPGATSYKLIKTTTSNKYTYTNLKKGTNKFQVKVVVKDADGKLVATKMTYYRAAKIK